LAKQLDEANKILENGDVDEFANCARKLNKSAKKAIKLALPMEEKKADFKDYLELIKKRIEDDDDLGTYVSKKDKKMITDEANENMAWLNKNPNTNAKDIRAKEKKNLRTKLEQ